MIPSEIRPLKQACGSRIIPVPQRLENLAGRFKSIQVSLLLSGIQVYLEPNVLLGDVLAGLMGEGSGFLL